MTVASYHQKLSLNRKTLYAGILGVMTLCALANLYRNRDPYKAYIHSRADYYLTTHLLDTEFSQKCNELEYRLSGKISTNFFQVLQQLYNGKQIILTNDILFDLNVLAEKTGLRTSIGTPAKVLTKEVIDALLLQARYSFFYSPLVFSPLTSEAMIFNNKIKSERCLTFIPPWQKSDFPLLIILLPAGSSEDSGIRVIHQGKYLFFIPSQHPMLR